MSRVIRLLLLGEAATFIIAAAIHAGLLMSGYEHREAQIAESAIAAVLLAGAAVAWLRPASTRAVGLWTQGFALFLDPRRDCHDRRRHWTTDASRHRLPHSDCRGAGLGARCGVADASSTALTFW
jgi:hypothetical protein